MRTRGLRRPIVFLRVRCSILILLIKTVRCSIRSLFDRSFQHTRLQTASVRADCKSTCRLQHRKNEGSPSKAVRSTDTAVDSRSQCNDERRAVQRNKSSLPYCMVLGKHRHGRTEKVYEKSDTRTAGDNAEARSNDLANTKHAACILQAVMFS